MVFIDTINRKDTGEFSNYENEIRTKTGEMIDIAWSNALTKRADGMVVDITCLGVDLTERKRMEQELAQSHKLESIGTLAGGIAHEFNNILSIIIGNNEMIMDELPDESPLKECSDEIHLASMRAKDVVKQLLTFSRQDHAKREPMDIGMVVAESVKLIRSTIPANIDIKLSTRGRACAIVGNATQINQVLINLCSNAADALLAVGGTIEIGLGNANVDDRLRSQYQKNIPDGRYVKLCVSDDGPGILGADIHRIFDPYYTTKEIGAGTGIGLAVVHGIVERHGGYISVESTPGQKTTFTILFPVYEQEGEREVDQPIELPMGEERILFVDDEPAIVKAAKHRLENLGYSFQGTTDPLHALFLFRASPDAFDLVITDMAMPSMTGDVLISKILKIRPQIPTMLCTGYSYKISEERAREVGIGAFSMKPVDRIDFAFQIRRLLDATKQVDTHY